MQKSCKVRDFQGYNNQIRVVSDDGYTFETEQTIEGKFRLQIHKTSGADVDDEKAFYGEHIVPNASDLLAHATEDIALSAVNRDILQEKMLLNRSLGELRICPQGVGNTIDVFPEAQVQLLPYLTEKRIRDKTVLSRRVGPRGFDGFQEIRGDGGAPDNPMNPGDSHFMNPCLQLNTLLWGYNRTDNDEEPHVFQHFFPGAGANRENMMATALNHKVTAGANANRFYERRQHLVADLNAVAPGGVGYIQTFGNLVQQVPDNAGRAPDHALYVNTPHAAPPIQYFELFEEDQYEKYKTRLNYKSDTSIIQARLDLDLQVFGQTVGGGDHDNFVKDRKSVV